MTVTLRVLPHARVPAAPRPDAEAHPAWDLVDALTRRYAYDAHTVQYRAAPDARWGRHRLSIEALPQLRADDAAPELVIALVDVDCPAAHREGREAPATWRDEQHARIDALRRDHPGVVGWDTRGGYRLVALLPQPIVLCTDADIGRWRRDYARRLAWLARTYGIVGDAACVDWTRLHRLPHTTRPGGGGVPEERRVHGVWTDLGAWPEHIHDVGTDQRTLADTPALAVLARHVAELPTQTSPRSPRTRPVATPQVVADLSAIPGVVRGLAAALSSIERGQGKRHDALLAVVGTLVRGGLPVAVIERVARDLRAALGETSDEIPSAVRTTLRRHAAGQVHYARGFLSEYAPAVLAALAPLLDAVREELAARRDEQDAVRDELREQSAIDAVTGPEITSEELSAPEASPLRHALRERRALDRVPAPSEVSADEASAQLVALLDRVRSSRGLAVAGVTTGAGKSHAASAAAIAAAKAGKRTVILAVSHAVARESVARLQAADVRVAYLGSVLSVVRDDGTPECRHAAGAQALASAGVTTLEHLCDGKGYATRPRGDDATRRSLPVLQRALDGIPPPPGEIPHGPHDEPCAHRLTCRAYQVRREQLVAMESADVLVTVHGLADAAHAWLSARPGGGLAVIDEAPELVDAARITRAEIEAAAREIEARRSAVARTEQWRGELLAALAAGIAPDETITAMLARGLPQLPRLATDTDEQRAAVIREWAQGSGLTRTKRPRTRHTPRPSQRVIRTARSRAQVPAATVAALRVAGLVARGLAAEHGYAPRCHVAVGTRDYGPDAGATELRVTAWAQDLAALLSDATIGRVILDATADPQVLSRIAGHTIEAASLAVTDGAPIERLYVPWSHGNRRACLPGGAIEWSELRGPLCEGIRLASRDLPAGSRLLAVTWQPVADELRRGAIDPQVRALMDELQARGVSIEWAHYGATRGIDRWRGVDAVLCVGTPWPDGGAIAQVCAAIGLPGGARDVGAWLAAAELEQCIGRIRAPRRRAAARVVVVAAVPPLRADRRWQVHALPTGRPAAPDSEVSERTLRRRRAAAAEAVAHAPTSPDKSGGHNPLQSIPATGCVRPICRVTAHTHLHAPTHADPLPGVPLPRIETVATAEIEAALESVAWTDAPGWWTASTAEARSGVG